MSGTGRNSPDRLDPEPVPPFWIPESALTARRVDPLVIQTSQNNWPWAYWLVSRELHDGERAAQIVEDVAVHVTRRLLSDPEVARNLRAYYRTAVLRTVQAIAVRESRIVYKGSAGDLETNHPLIAADWLKALEDRLTLTSLLPFMSHAARQIMHYRQLDYSWKELARRLGLTEKQAKSRFYYGIKQAHQELCAAQQLRAGAERSRRNGLE